MIYVLHLEKNKFYVGEADDNNDFYRILLNHTQGRGSIWTRKYRVLGVFRKINRCECNSDKYVKQYMNKFGIANVRGGSYDTIILNDDQKKILMRELRNMNDLCFRCGSNGHYANECTAKKDVNGKSIERKNNIFIRFCSWLH